MDRTSEVRGQAREWLVLGLCVVALLSTCACPPPSVTTSVGRTAAVADQVVLRIGELQTAAIDANAAGQLSTTATRTVVKWCVAANTTLKNAPEGWQATVAGGLQALKEQLAPAERDRLGIYLAALDLAVTSLVSAGGSR